MPAPEGKSLLRPQQDRDELPHLRRGEVFLRLEELEAGSQARASLLGFDLMSVESVEYPAHRVDDEVLDLLVHGVPLSPVSRVRQKGYNVLIPVMTCVFGGSTS